MTADDLPTFLVIGAMKAGTSTLHALLSRHPDVFMTEVKEPEFFSEDEHWERGLEWYRSLFVDGRDRPARGEASTGYTRLPRYPAAAERIAATVPGVRLVYLLRDPVERAVSHHRHSVLAGRERRPADVALLADDGLLAPSRYASQLRSHLAYHDASNVHVCFTEDLDTEPRRTVDEIAAFVGVGPLPDTVGTEERHNVSGERPALRGPLRRLADGPVGEFVRTTGLDRVARRVLRPSPELLAPPGPDTVATVRERLADELDDLESLIGALPWSWRA